MTVAALSLIARSPASEGALAMPRRCNMAIWAVSCLLYPCLLRYTLPSVLLVRFIKDRPLSYLVSAD